MMNLFNHWRGLRFRGVAVLIVTTYSAVPVQANTLDWTGATSSSWSNPANWSPNGVPTLVDVAQITNGGTVHLNDLEASVAAIRLGPINVNQTGGGGTLNVSPAAAGLTTRGAFIADGAMSTGTVNVSDFATWSDSGAGFKIGSLGVGRVEITRSGEFTRTSETTFFDYSLFLGEFAGSEGTLIVDQSKFTHTGGRGVIVGDEGQGTLEVRKESTAINNGFLEIGRQAGSQGTVTIDDSTWTNSADVNVGFLGVGTLLLKNDAVLSARSSNVSDLSTATVDHAAWNNTNFFGSRGMLEVKQGGVVSANQVSISAGQTTITDSVLIARNSLTIRETGALNLNSGVLHVSDNLLTPFGSGALIGNGTGLGQLNVESGGALNFASGAAAAIDGLQGTQATVTGGGSRWIVDTVNVGKLNRGQMFITSGGEVTSFGPSGTTFLIGVEPSAHGELSVDGKSSTGVPAKLHTDTLLVGNTGRGNMTVRNGANVISRESAIGNSASQNFAGGEATVTGLGSLWSISSRLIVSNSNTGTLNINNGGRVEVGSSPTNSSVVIGRFPGLLPGAITIEHAGSTLDVLGSITVGDLGIGEMQIKNQGHVENDAAWIGYGQGSQGKVRVDNGTWLVRDLLTVGLLGNAELDIRNGGLVVAKNGVFVGPGGMLLGTGGITGDGVTVLVENSGTAMPGTSPGTFSITGNYQQNASGKLQIELASPTSYDVLNVTGSAMLGGTLDIRLLDGYLPAPTDTFNFLQAGSHTGMFSNVTVSSSSGASGTFSLTSTPTGLALGNYQLTSSGNGLIAHWDAESGATDVTGNGHDGIFQGDAATTTAGPFGKSFSLDGNGDYISIGDELDMGSSDFTLSAWIKGDPAMNQWGRIFDKGYSSGYALGRRGFTNEVGFEFLASGSQGNNFATTTSLIDDTWHHVALVKSGNTVTLYADGEAENTEFISGAAQDNALPLLIGFNPGEGTQGYWKGLLDELKIFNRALTLAEIAALALMAAGVPGDYNNNGVVDAADYVLWRNGGPLANEVDAPGTVNAADYAAWRVRFGNTSGSGASNESELSLAAVPEPNVTLVILLGWASSMAILRSRAAVVANHCSSKLPKCAVVLRH